jgi:hypothetical protein
MYRRGVKNRGGAKNRRAAMNRWGAVNRRGAVPRRGAVNRRGFVNRRGAVTRWAMGRTGTRHPTLNPLTPPPSPFPHPGSNFVTRYTVQTFEQDKTRQGILYNHDNEFLHYEDDW